MDFSARNGGRHDSSGFPDIIAVQGEHKTKDGNEPYGPQPNDCLSVYLKGGPRYALGGHLFKADAPFGVLLPANTEDRDLQVGEAEAVWVLFLGKGIIRRDPEDPSHAVTFLPGGSTVSVPMLKPLAFRDAHAIAETIREIGRLEAGDRIGELRRIGLLLQALSDYCTFPQRPEGRVTHREAAHLRELIVQTAFKDVSLSDVYDKLTLSPSNADKLFVKAFGTTPVSFRTHLRMARARELLVTSRLNVKQVAKRVGYTDPLYFSRAFRRHFGMSPSRLIADFRPNMVGG